MWEVRIGEIIRSRREKLNIRQAKLSEGICTVSTLSKIENGVIFPTRYKLQYLMERLGIDSEQYVILSSKREIELNEMVRVFNSCLKKDPEVATYMLKRVEKAADSANDAEYQIFGECSLRLDITERKKPLESIEKETLELLRDTKPEFSRDRLRNELLSKTEWNILIDYAKVLMLLNRKEEALEVLLGLKEYLSGKHMDAELIRGDYETVLLRIVETLVSMGRFFEADNYSDELLEGLYKNKATANLVEIMINRTTIAINLRKPPEHVKRMITQTREVIKMDRGSETAERFDDYIRKECGYA
ncbi:MAG: helix-turn-helix domain-containing protein [Lachnospiraceae bacterium]|nr:helix-turn-helix domain-containing protein [Lachnospiraceae bacterium]